MHRPVLRRRLTLEEPVELADGGGGSIGGWREVGTLWADVRAVSGSEMLQGGRDRQRVTHRVIVRGAPVGSPRRPSPHQRFRDGSRIFDILAVAENDPDGRFILCWTEEGGSA
ncbi:MAG: head-tail adaptor protein [Alphaproteobacteria bacterium]|nr:MAG: head-tail adaptor protein [Alphaproteobacteria bacterium]